MKKCLLCGLLLLLCWVSAHGATPEATILNIQAEIQDGKLDAAERAIAIAMKNAPRDGGLYNLRGIVYADRNQLKTAEKDFIQAIELNPHFVGAYLNFGRTCEMLEATEPGALNSAIAQYRRLLKLQPEASAVRLQLAKLLEKSEDYAFSLKELDTLPLADSREALAISLRCADLAGIAAAYTRGGQLSEARRTLEKMVSVDPANSAPLMELARIAEKQNDLNGALGYLAHARDLNPNYAPVHFFFGVVCIELDLPVEAKKSLQKALDLDPENAAYNYARGSVELQGKAAWQAIPYFKKFVAAEPDDPRGRFALGVAEFASQDYELAAKEMNSVAHNKETTAGAEYFLGRIAKTESDWDKASAHFQRSIEADTNYADSHAELGLARMHLNDMAGARTELNRALELNPNSYIANGNLLALFQRTKDPLAKSQEEKLRALDSTRSEKQELMLRAIKIRRDVN
jgi:tetratricopeptide (TPR) repeat protein